MPNSILEDFQRRASAQAYWWNDNPKEFIQHYLNGFKGLDLADTEKRDSLEKAWDTALIEDRKQAKAHLEALYKVMPPRPKGELLYVLSFLGDEESGGHLTLLGPTFFYENSAAQGFKIAVEDFITDMPALSLTISEMETIETRFGLERKVHLIENSFELSTIHAGLAGLAVLYGGLLIEEEFSKEAYMPHVTHHEGCELIPSDELLLERVSISIHPGARINVSNARTFGSYNFRK